MARSICSAEQVRKGAAAGGENDPADLASLPDCMAWKMAECSESTGKSCTPRCFASGMRSEPATTSDSLFASAICFPARTAARTGLSPAAPTIAARRRRCRRVDHLRQTASADVNFWAERGDTIFVRFITDADGAGMMRFDLFAEFVDLFVRQLGRRPGRAARGGRSLPASCSRSNRSSQGLRCVCSLGRQL